MTRMPSTTTGRLFSFKLERWHRRSIYATGIVLLLSGAAWLVLHYFLRPVSEFGETVNPLEPWAMKLHGAAAMATLFFVGSLLHLHVRRALRAGRNAVTGWAMIATLSFLTLTGYGLYYVAGEGDRPVWSLLHWSVGFAVAVLFVVHVLVGRRSVHD
jgi:cytochrome b561